MGTGGNREQDGEEEKVEEKEEARAIVEEGESENQLDSAEQVTCILYNPISISFRPIIVLYFLN